MMWIVPVKLKFLCDCCVNNFFRHTGTHRAYRTITTAQKKALSIWLWMGAFTNSLHHRKKSNPYIMPACKCVTPKTHGQSGSSSTEALYLDMRSCLTSQATNLGKQLLSLDNNRSPCLPQWRGWRLATKNIARNGYSSPQWVVGYWFLIILRSVGFGVAWINHDSPTTAAHCEKPQLKLLSTFYRGQKTLILKWPSLPINCARKAPAHHRIDQRLQGRFYNRSFTLSNTPT